MSELSDGWSNFDFTLTPEAKHVFETTTSGPTGVKFTPLGFAVQVLAGTRYSFLCEAESVSRHPARSVVKIRIFQALDNGDMPIDARPVIESIETIYP
jgi:hypothetical protein